MISKKLRQMVYEKYDGHCAYCGKKIDYKDMQVDHVIPKASSLYWGNARGVCTDEIENLMPSCRACNFRKGTLSVDQFRNEIRKQCDGIIQRSFQVRMSLAYGLLRYTDHDIVFYFEKEKEDKNERIRKQVSPEM